MTEQRFLHVVYCDDVRREEGNKLSLMGVYGANLIVPTFPATLPKLCAILTARTPVAAPFKHLTFRVEFEDQVLGETSTEIPDAPVDHDTRFGIPSYYTLSAIMEFAPLTLEHAGKLRARLVSESGEIRGNALLVVDTASLPPQSAVPTAAE